MILGKKLSFKQFILSQVLILMTGLMFLIGLYYVLNNTDSQKKSRSPFYSGPITTSPKILRLELDQPDQNLLTYSSSTIVSGKTGPGNLVLISTDHSDLVIKSKQDGSFSTVLNLEEGVNKITATVFDLTGDYKSDQRLVYYSKEKI